MGFSVRDQQIIAETNKPSIDVVYTRVNKNNVPTHCAFNITITWKNDLYPPYTYTTLDDPDQPDFNLEFIKANKPAILIKMFNKVDEYKKSIAESETNKLELETLLNSVWGV
jgi:hypothetical protein